MHYGLNIQNPIAESMVVRDLRISVFNDVSFHMHITKTPAKCSQVTGWILKFFKITDHEIMLTPGEPLFSAACTFASTYTQYIVQRRLKQSNATKLKRLKQSRG